MNFEIHNNDFSKTTGFHHLDNVDNHRRIVDTIKKVGIIRSKKQSTLYGTGWFISHSIVVTNAHVLDEIRNVKNVVFDLRCECKSSKTLSYHFKRQIEITDDDIQKLNLGSMKLDIAFLEISKLQRKVLNLSNTVPNVNSEVIAIGYPELPSNQGCRSKKHLHYGAITKNSNNIEFEHNCKTYKGNSGSPLIDIQNGKLIGLHYFNNSSIRLAIDVEIIKQLASIKGIKTF